MKFLLKLFFIVYFHLFYKKESDIGFAITRAFNLLLLNLVLVLLILLSITIKVFPEIIKYLPDLSRYSFGFIILAIIFFGIHYLFAKKLKEIANDSLIQYPPIIINKKIIYFSIPFLIVVLIIIEILF